MGGGGGSGGGDCGGCGGGGGGDVTVRPVVVGSRPRPRPRRVGRVGRVGVVLCRPERVVFGGGPVTLVSSSFSVMCIEFSSSDTACERRLTSMSVEI